MASSFVSIDKIVPGDTVIHNGEIKTVCHNNLSRDKFMGLLLFGDSYHCGNKLVERVTINRALPKINSANHLRGEYQAP